ncbi:MAG: cation:proton antiporter [Bacteroidetes bacterium QH_2_64_74]|jgi:multicomponent Na+:H+ antiporter subunit F|nr:MAG: cation:proton antiporter [Bacteroidetes bacterium QH_2_64_74]
MSAVEGPLLWAGYLSLGVLGLSILAALLRVLWGPHLSDRVIALDLVAFLAMGFLATYSVMAEEEAFIDVALVLGLLAFLGTVAVARYIERVRSGEALVDS